MSRVAKAPITLPSNIDLTLTEDEMTVKGPKGVITNHVNRLVSIERDTGNNHIVTFKPSKVHPDAWAHAGTARALLNNMIKGVTEGFTSTLELVGVGYRAQAVNNIINLSLGYSHPIEYTLPEGVQAETPNNTTIILKGINKQLVGQIASKIRAFRKPEPYKGKGIKYSGENIARKEAKKK